MLNSSQFHKFIIIFLITISAFTGVTASAVNTTDPVDRSLKSQFQSIVGSWELIDDQNGDTFFGTYNGGLFKGTVNFTTPNNTNSLTHGAWIRTGPHSFADTDIGFIYDENGEAILKIKFRAKIELDKDGNTVFFDYEFEVSQFDGTVVNSGASNATGTRIVVNF